MKVLIKKFSLLRDGLMYGAGQIVDLPDEEAMKLVQNAPKEFALLEEAVVAEAEPPAAVPAQKEKPAKKAGKKNEATDNAAEAVDGLPAIDADALVK